MYVSAELLNEPPQDKTNKMACAPIWGFNRSSIDQTDKYLTVCDICFPVCFVVGRESYTDGTRRTGGMWRVCLKDPVASAQVLVTGINLRDTQVALYDKKTLLTSREGGC